MRVFYSLTIFGVALALVHGQEGNGGGNGHGHLPGHVKEVAHTPNLDSPKFLSDSHMHGLVMVTSSGCYVEHVNVDLSKTDAAVLIILEKQLLESVRSAKKFLQVIFPDALQHFNHAIQASCQHTHLYHWQ